MRHIHLEEGLRLRFPARDEAFNQGVEIGMLAVLMSAGRAVHLRRIATGTVEQARALAEKMGYHLVVEEADAAFSRIMLRPGRARPQMTLVHAANPAGAPELSARRASLSLA